MIKATYDTNTLASATVALHGSISFLFNALINGEVEMITSKPLLAELSKTLQKSYFTSRLSEDQAKSFIDLVQRRSTITPITTPIPKVATHPEDDIVLATAESGKASYIVTGDHGLQNLKKFKNIQIVNPKTFAEILEAEKYI